MTQRTKTIKSRTGVKEKIDKRRISKRGIDEGRFPANTSVFFFLSQRNH